MITEKQAEARRQNGKLSKGPKTTTGKAASSRNSLKHGFRSRNPLVPGEHPDDLAKFRAELVESIAPASALESLFANCLVDAAWQMRRLPAAVSEVLTSGMYAELAKKADREAWHSTIGSSPETDSKTAANPAKCRAALRRKAAMKAASTSPETALGRAIIRDAKAGAALWKISRYQTATERTLFRCLHEIQRLQATRAGKAETPANEFLPNEPTDLTPGVVESRM